MAKPTKVHVVGALAAWVTAVKALVTALLAVSNGSSNSGGRTTVRCEGVRVLGLGFWGEGGGWGCCCRLDWRTRGSGRGSVGCKKVI